MSGNYVKAPAYPMVFIAWTDTIQGATGWDSMDERLKETDDRDGIVHQIGFLIDETEDHVIILDGYLQSEDMVGTIHKIPKGAIEKQIELEEKLTR